MAGSPRRSLRDAQLTELLEESRAWNAAHGITGVLCHSQEEFVQLIEGETQHVQYLYAHIQRDARHQQIVT